MIEPTEKETLTPDATPSQSKAKIFKSKVERSKKKRRELISDWSTNIDYRRGKVSDIESDEQRTPLTIDWSQTKAKQAQLFSQVPQIIATAKSEKYRPAVSVFVRRVNDLLGPQYADVGTAMDEVLPDCINASGIGAVIVSYDARTEMVEVPTIDPSTLPPEFQTQLGQIPTETVPKLVDYRYNVARISPADLLWPTEFIGSDFDKGPWIGRTGRLPWAEAQKAFKLRDDQREACVGDDRTSQDRLTNQDQRTDTQDVDSVEFDEIFYWRYRFHPEEKYFDAIQHLVFVNGVEQPVVDEPWKGQLFDEQSGGYVGSCRFPIRVLTLTYLTDEPIPPSDTAVGRPMVDELMRSRSQMTEQRDHSKPIRWFDVNRVDPAIQQNLMEGHWQGMIPTNGDGTRVIGEVARSNYPRESFDFDRVYKGDLQEAWQVGDNQVGAFASGERSAREATIVQANFQTRIGYERARVVKFFIGIADVLAGFVALFDEFDDESVSEEDRQLIEQWERTKINQRAVFSVRADATVLLDSNQRIERLMRFVNMTAKSGYLNIQPIIEELASLSGLDPAIVVKTPEPKKEEPPNISYRFSGTEDLNNPIVLAMLVKAGQAPTPEEMAAAQKILEAARLGVTPPQAEVPQGPQMGEVMTDQQPQWAMADRINTRRDGGDE